MRALCAAGAACVHYLAGKESINISGKCHSGLARQEISKIYACCPCSMRRKTTSLTVLPVSSNISGGGDRSNGSAQMHSAVWLNRNTGH